MIAYEELTQTQRRTLNRDIKRLMTDMFDLGVEIVDLTFYMDRRATTHDTTTPQDEKTPPLMLI